MYLKVFMYSILYVGYIRVKIHFKKMLTEIITKVRGKKF